MKQRRGILWLTTGVILAILAALLTLRFLSSVTPTSAAPDQAVTVPVVVARSDIPMRTLLTEDMVMIRQMPPELVPMGAATTLDQVVGKISKADLVTGEVVLVERLADPARKGENILFTMPEDKVVIALPAEDLMSQAGLLKPGDKVDILYSLEMEAPEAAGGVTVGGKLVTFAALQNQEISAIVLPGFRSKAVEGAEEVIGTELAGELDGKVILLAVDPQDALVLKHLKDAGGIVDFVLRAPTNEKLLRTQPVTEDFLTDRYQIEITIEGPPGQPGIACEGVPGCPSE